MTACHWPCCHRVDAQVETPSSASPGAAFSSSSRSSSVWPGCPSRTTPAGMKLNVISHGPSPSSTVRCGTPRASLPQPRIATNPRLPAGPARDARPARSRSPGAGDAAAAVRPRLGVVVLFQVVGQHGPSGTRGAPRQTPWRSCSSMRGRSSGGETSMVQFTRTARKTQAAVFVGTLIPLGLWCWAGPGSLCP